MQRYFAVRYGNSQARMRHCNDKTPQAAGILQTEIRYILLCAGQTLSYDGETAQQRSGGGRNSLCQT